MSLEGQLLDRKSLRAVTGKTADWGELAKDCVAFANALGGRLLIGIEDGEALPPAAQSIPADLPDAGPSGRQPQRTVIHKWTGSSLLRNEMAPS